MNYQISRVLLLFASIIMFSHFTVANAQYNRSISQQQTRQTRSSVSVNRRNELPEELFNNKKDNDESKKKKKEKKAKEKNNKKDNSVNDETTVTTRIVEQTKEESMTESLEKDDVVLVVYGNGKNKEEATKIALRSAIEQAFGTFVSSNTNILNDEIVKDEIVTVSSGNIKSYQYLSEDRSNSNYNVAIKAVVSIGKLISYTQAKGGQTELAGATFAMDVKLKKLYTENEEAAFRHLIVKLKEYVPNMFDYSITVSDPVANLIKHCYVCKSTITIKTNKNYEAAHKMIWETFNALKMTENEFWEYRNKGVYPIEVTFYDGITKKTMYFRSLQFFGNLRVMLNDVLEHFYIEDNLGKYELSHHHERGIVWVGDKAERAIFEAKAGPKSIEFNHNRQREPTGMGFCYGTNVKEMFFPVNSYAYWTIEGRLQYKLEELEKLSNVKVLPYITEQK